MGILMLKNGNWFEASEAKRYEIGNDILWITKSGNFVLSVYTPDEDEVYNRIIINASRVIDYLIEMWDSGECRKPLDWYNQFPESISSEVIKRIKEREI